jgi:hypothetical protein
MHFKILVRSLATLFTATALSLAIAAPVAQASMPRSQETLLSQCDNGGAGNICWYTSSDSVGHGVFGSDERDYTPVAWVSDDSTSVTGAAYSTVQSTACAGDSTSGPFGTQAFDTDYCGYQVDIIKKSGGNTCMAQAAGMIVFHACPGDGDSTATLWVRDTDTHTWVNIVRSDYCRSFSSDCYNEEGACTPNPDLHTPMGIADTETSTDQLCLSSYGYNFRMDA